MKKKGFTLIELLAVIVVLGIILSIVVISVQGTIDKSRRDAVKILKNEIKDAAKKYVVDNITTIEDGYYVYANNLVTGAYIEELKDPNDNSSNCYNADNAKDTSIQIGITTTVNGNYKYTYTVTLKCGTDGHVVTETE